VRVWIAGVDLVGAESVVLSLMCAWCVGGARAQQLLCVMHTLPVFPGLWQTSVTTVVVGRGVPYVHWSTGHMYTGAQEPTARALYVGFDGFFYCLVTESRCVRSLLCDVGCCCVGALFPRTSGWGYCCCTMGWLMLQWPSPLSLFEFLKLPPVGLRELYSQLCTASALHMLQASMVAAPVFPLATCGMAVA